MLVNPEALNPSPIFVPLRARPQTHTTRNVIVVANLNPRTSVLVQVKASLASPMTYYGLA